MLDDGISGQWMLFKIVKILFLNLIFFVEEQDFQVQDCKRCYSMH